MKVYLAVDGNRDWEAQNICRLSHSAVLQAEAPPAGSFLGLSAMTAARPSYDVVNISTY